MRGIKALLLDLDDTLFDEAHAARQAFQVFLEDGSVRRPDESDEAMRARWQACIQRHWQRYEQGELTLDQQRWERMREFLSRPDLDDETAAARFQPYMQRYRQHHRLLPGAAEFLAATRHLTRIIVSNGGHAMQQEKLRGLGIDRHFDHLVTPDQAGAAKPDARIFRHALALSGQPASACLMVGDDLARDIAPAQQLGMAACHVAAGAHAHTFSTLSLALQDA